MVEEESEDADVIASAAAATAASLLANSSSHRTIPWSSRSVSSSLPSYTGELLLLLLQLLLLLLLLLPGLVLVTGMLSVSGGAILTGLEGDRLRLRLLSPFFLPLVLSLPPRLLALLRLSLPLLLMLPVKEPLSTLLLLLLLWLNPAAETKGREAYDSSSAREFKSLLPSRSFLQTLLRPLLSLRFSFCLR